MLEDFELRENSVIFTNTYLVEDLFEKLNSSKFRNIKIISSQTDHSINEKIFLKKPPSVSVWFSTNVNYQNEALVPIPLGLANEYSPKNLFKSDYTNLIPVNKKSNFIYLNFEDNTNYFHRNYLKRKLTDNGLTILENQKITKFKYLENLNKFQYILCPFGNGFDTHRIWETLYAGSLPVIPYNPFLLSILNNSNIFFKNIKDINDIVIQNMYGNYDEILQIDYWINKVKKSGNYMETASSENIVFNFKEVNKNYLLKKDIEYKLKKRNTLKRKIHNNIVKIYT